MKLLSPLLLLVFLAACATPPTVVDEAREHFREGRSEQALALLQQASKKDPEDLRLRAEYFRLRELLLAQWLAQAEMLRQSGHFELAEGLYRRVQTHDATNARAASGLA
ncbi:MAG TPA: hypothetical protein VIQ55_11590, partial [Burkholderiales bacterium]